MTNDDHIVTRLMAQYQVAMASPLLDEAEKDQLSAEYLEAVKGLPPPRWSTNSGPQALAYVTEADELFYGGAAGGGKTALLLGLATTAHKQTLILRKHGTELTEMKKQIELMVRAGDRWKNIGHGGEFRTYDRRVMEMLGCDDEKRANKLQGRAHDAKCVAKGTLILMGDRSYLPIQDIVPGDEVMTLIGPRRVLRTIRKGVRECADVTVAGTTTQVSMDHHLLTPSAWVSPRALRPTGHRTAPSKSAASDGRRPAFSLPVFGQQLDRLRAGAVWPSSLDGAEREGIDAYQEDGRTSFEVSYGQRQEPLPPAKWFAPVVLHGPDLLSAGSCLRQSSLGCAREGDPLWSSTPGSRLDCHDECGCRDERLHPALGAAQAGIPLQGGAGSSGQPCCTSGGHARTPSHSRQRLWFRHPYTLAPLVSSESCHVRVAEMVQAGAEEVFDLTVAEAAHYVTYGGIISKNCWDEICQFNEATFRFVNMWNRTTIPGQRSRVVGAGNPPLAAEEEWVLRYWGPWLDDANKSYPARPGEVRWFTTIEGKDEEVADSTPITVTYQGKSFVVKPKSRTFIPASLNDNPDLMASDYASRLAAAPEPYRTQLLFGDMKIGRLDHEHQVIPTEWLMRSMKQRWKPNGRGDKRMDCAALDCAMMGKDKMALAKRYDRWIAPLKTWPGKDIKEGRDAVMRVLLELESLHMPLLIDVLATPGGAVVQAFREQFREVRDVPLQIWAVNFGEGSEFKDRSGRLEMSNKRAEAYWRLREGLDPNGGPPETRLQLPDDPELAAELCNVRWKPVGGRVLLEKKEEITERIGRSPDKADAVAMTMLCDSTKGGWVPMPQLPITERAAPQPLRPAGYEISRQGVTFGGAAGSKGIGGFMGAGG